jgi:hypothetical protein
LLTASLLIADRHFLTEEISLPRSRGSVRLAWLVAMGLFAASSGATCYPSLVCQLPPDPTMDDVLAAVDGNANLVQSLLATRRLPAALKAGSSRG